MDDLNDYLKGVSADVDRALEGLVPEGPPDRLYEAVRWSLFAGGKRFRPALVCAAGEAFGVGRAALLHTASSIEMIHTYSLIHDDLPAMDDDDLRRGRATCHVKFGEATAILAGDVLQSLAVRAVAEDRELDARLRLRIVSEIAEAAMRMVDGQQLDLEAEGRPTTVAGLETIHNNKTGAMIRASARCGAMIGGADEAGLEAVTRYASALGLLFQITDDILDITATTEDMGKTVGKDAASDKATYPGFYGLDRSRELASEVHSDAVSALSSLGSPAQRLRQIADFILSRRS